MLVTLCQREYPNYSSKVHFPLAELEPVLKKAAQNGDFLAVYIMAGHADKPTLTAILCYALVSGYGYLYDMFAHKISFFTDNDAIFICSELLKRNNHTTLIELIESNKIRIQTPQHNFELIRLISLYKATDVLDVLLTQNCLKAVSINQSWRASHLRDSYDYGIVIASKEMATAILQTPVVASLSVDALFDLLYADTHNQWNCIEDLLEKSGYIQQVNSLFDLNDMVSGQEYEPQLFEKLVHFDAQFTRTPLPDWNWTGPDMMRLYYSFENYYRKGLFINKLFIGGEYSAFRRKDYELLIAQPKKCTPRLYPFHFEIPLHKAIRYRFTMLIKKLQTTPHASLTETEMLLWYFIPEYLHNHSQLLPPATANEQTVEKWINSLKPKNEQQRNNILLLYYIYVHDFVSKDKDETSPFVIPAYFFGTQKVVITDEFLITALRNTSQWASYILQEFAGTIRPELFDNFMWLLDEQDEEEAVLLLIHKYAHTFTDWQKLQLIIVLYTTTYDEVAKASKHLISDISHPLVSLLAKKTYSEKARSTHPALPEIPLVVNETELSDFLKLLSVKKSESFAQDIYVFLQKKIKKNQLQITPLPASEGLKYFLKQVIESNGRPLRFHHCTIPVNDLICFIEEDLVSVKTEMYPKRLVDKAFSVFDKRVLLITERPEEVKQLQYLLEHKTSLTRLQIRQIIKQVSISKVQSIK